MITQMRSLRPMAIALVLAVAAACGDRGAKRAEADSALARDLALAGTQAAQPSFQDTAIAPAPAQAGDTRRKALPPLSRVPEQPARETPRTTTPAPVAEPSPVTVASAPSAASGPSAGRAEVGAGTGIAVTSGSKVCTSSLPGDKFVATVNQAVTGANGAAIPAGSSVVLEVASVAVGDNPDGAQMTFRVRAVVIGDRTYPVSADVTPEAALVKGKVQNVDPNADKKKVIGGAIAGAILGRMIGHDTKGAVIGAATGAAAGAAVARSGEKWEACLPAGSPLKLTLSQSLVIS